MVYFVGKVGKLTKTGLVVVLDPEETERPTRIWLRGEVSGVRVGDRVRVGCTARWIKNGEGFKLEFSIFEVKVR